MTDVPEKCKKSKGHYESAVNLGKYLYKLMLGKLNDSDENFDISDIDQLDLSALHGKLCLYHNRQANKAKGLQEEFKVLKDLRNDIQHITQSGLNEFTDTYILQKINGLRELFGKILVKINVMYNEIIVDDEKLKLDDELDQIMNRISFEVTDSEVEPFLNELHGRKCPSKVKIRIKESPQNCTQLMPLIERLSTENISVWLLIDKAYFEEVDQLVYDSQKYLEPLLVNNNCKLTRYRGNLSTDLIRKLPSTLTQLSIRMRPDQIEHLHGELPRLTELKYLCLYLDLTKQGRCYEVNIIAPSSLPEFGYKGKQLSLRICACITTGNIPWVIEVIKKLKMNHQCDCLEFYQTRLNTGAEIEELLKALHNSGIHVTKSVKVQNEETNKDIAEENRLNKLANKNQSLSGFKFMRHWSEDHYGSMTLSPSASNASFDTSMAMDTSY